LNDQNIGFEEWTPVDLTELEFTDPLNGNSEVSFRGMFSFEVLPCITWAFFLRLQFMHQLVHYLPFQALPPKKRNKKVWVKRVLPKAVFTIRLMELRVPCFIHHQTVSNI
jgi:hypothetical protein